VSAEKRPDPTLSSPTRSIAAAPNSTLLNHPRAGQPAAPGTYAGRARLFRRAQAERRTDRRDRVWTVFVVFVIGLGVFVVVTATPYSPLGYNGLPKPGPVITVTLASPVVSSISCGSGGTAISEEIGFVSSSKPVATGELVLRLYEIWDGDYIGDPNAVANASATNACEGAPPTTGALWYVVLTAPKGTNALTFTGKDLWQPIGGSPTNLTLRGGYTFVVITAYSLSGTGRGFGVEGYEAGSRIQGSVPL